MKQPQLKKLLRASKDAEEIRSFDHVFPPSVDVPWNVSIRWFCGSSLVSCQIANHSPCPSTPIAGKNWSPRAALPDAFTETGTGSVQVAPRSPEVCTEMS